MATISSSIISSTTYLHLHSSSKPFKTHSQTSLKISNVRQQQQPTRLFCVAEETVVTAVDPTSEAARRLYVGNIPRTTNNDELQKVFEEHGSIEKVEDWLFIRSERSLEPAQIHPVTTCASESAKGFCNQSVSMTERTFLSLSCNHRNRVSEVSD
ncbi:RNA-binding (RRM/RBD/RNP motifs) family protein [Artemisia annua]|uniref:RNA-binding (RRM/RBD/RNP motifs) family protein n=1 Tax=Artemisia annua TaxID=35608 RepID=A0A2U1MCW9_ARTAN|nr:RNA-binding (RRM/RBD/RNP motifs) family protein [Artemisia annua]